MLGMVAARSALCVPRVVLHELQRPQRSDFTDYADGT